MDNEYISFALKFMTFGNISPKLWPNMLFFFVNGQFGEIRKNHFFQEQEFEIDIFQFQN